MHRKRHSNHATAPEERAGWTSRNLQWISFTSNFCCCCTEWGWFFCFMVWLLVWMCVCLWCRSRCVFHPFPGTECMHFSGLHQQFTSYSSDLSASSWTPACTNSYPAGLTDYICRVSTQTNMFTHAQLFVLYICKIHFQSPLTDRFQSPSPSAYS